MDWNDVQYFLALARLGSVRGAGASLGVSHSTVARRVEALETRLSTRLFDRTRDGYTLTDAGNQMMRNAERVESEMHELERGLLGQDDRLEGPVSVTCCDNFVADIVLGGLVSFCEKFPEIEIEFITDSRKFDLSKREADIAIRTVAAGTKPADFLVGMKLAPVTIANYVSVAHEQRLDPTARSTRWISFEDRKIQDQLIANSSYPNLAAWGSFSTLELLVQAAEQGYGIVMLPTYVGDCAPKLTRLPNPDVKHVGDLWLLTHPDLRSNARLKATREAVADAIKQRSNLFYGTRCTGGTERPKNVSRDR